MEPSSSGGEPHPDNIPKTLIDRGWRQGTVFRVQETEQWIVTPLADGEFGWRTSATPSDGRFVIVSQSCDIAAPIAAEPVVEAIACSVIDDENTRASYRQSFRRFEIHPEQGLFAYPMYRLPFDKPAMLLLTPEPWPGTEERLRAFSRWLARRAGRPAIPDPIVKAFVDPLRSAVRELRKRRAVEHSAFTSEVMETRFVVPAEDRPPFAIVPIFLMEGNMLSTDAANAIDWLTETLGKKIDPSLVQLENPEIYTKSRMSVEIYFRTAIVDLEGHTYCGDDIVGAESAGPI